MNSNKLLRNIYYVTFLFQHHSNFIPCIKYCYILISICISFFMIHTSYSLRHYYVTRMRFSLLVCRVDYVNSYVMFNFDWRNFETYKREYQFNFCGKTWTPSCLQCLNNLGWFAFFMCSMCIYQGIIFDTFLISFQPSKNHAEPRLTMLIVEIPRSSRLWTLKLIV